MVMLRLFGIILVGCLSGLLGTASFADGTRAGDRSIGRLFQNLARPPAAIEILRGTHSGRVTGISLSADQSYDAEGMLIIPARFEIDVEEAWVRAANESPPAPLQVVAWSTEGELRGVFVDTQTATISGTEGQVRAIGTATIRIDTAQSGSLFRRAPRYNVRIVDPVSGTASAPISVQRQVTPWSSYLPALAFLGGLAAVGFALWQRRLWHRRFEALTRDLAGAKEYDELGGAQASAYAYIALADVPEVPPALVEAIASGKGFLATGTGLAAQAGLPSGTDLVRALVERFRHRLPGAFAAGDSRGTRYVLGKGMDVLLSTVSREEVTECIAQALRQSKPGASAFHQAALDLPWRGILSLAWDDLVPQAIARTKGQRWQRLRPDDQTAFTTALRDPSPIYLDVLGRVEFPASLSLSMDELRRALSRNPEWHRGLALLMQTHTFLFVGTNPEMLEHFFQALYLETVSPDQQPRHFALTPMGPETELWAHSLGRFGVGLLPYGPAENHRAVAVFADQLSAAVAAASGRPASPSIRHDTLISAISLRNIGPFDSLDLPLAVKSSWEDNSRPWTVIFGSNGMGKSTVLRAISLALVGSDLRAAGAGGKLLRSGAREGRIELKLGAETLTTRLYRDGANVIVDPVQVTPVQAGFNLILGIPALRGGPSPDPTGPSSQEPRLPDVADLLPLLNGEVDQRLGGFKQWLLNIMVQAGQDDPRAMAQRDLLDRIICDIVPGDIEGLMPVGSDFALRVRTADGPIPFESMSQGMSSIFNWLGVLIQRLYQAFPDSPKPEEQEATVIVDEIDAHLHPDWQRRLVGLTKANFPRLQVIATSHSPLLAGALHAPEMCVFHRNTEERIEPLERVPELFGHRSQVILTSAAFGLSTDRNPEVEKLFAEYFDLFQKASPTPEEQARLTWLEAEIAGYHYGGSVGPIKPLELPDVNIASEEDANQLQEQLARIKIGSADEQPNLGR